MRYPAYFQIVHVLVFVFCFSQRFAWWMEGGGKSGKCNLCCYIYIYAEANSSRKAWERKHNSETNKQTNKKPETGATSYMRHLSFIFIFHLGLPQSLSSLSLFLVFCCIESLFMLLLFSNLEIVLCIVSRLLLKVSPQRETWAVNISTSQNNVTSLATNSA